MSALETESQIRVMDLLGTPEDEMGLYTVRLNGFLEGYRDVLNLYYSDKDKLLEHCFTRKWSWNKLINGNIHTPRVLQFVQINPSDKTQWLFIGGYDLSKQEHKLYKEAEYHHDVYVFEGTEMPKFKVYAARLVVDFKRYQGDQRYIFNLNDERTQQHIRETMVVRKISESPVSALPFPGFQNVRLSHQELRAAIANDEWKGALESVKAVYLQTDRHTGWHYVGSAYGQKGSETGLLKRWSEYAGGNHCGGNKTLQTQTQRLAEEMGMSQEDYIEKYFQYSILDIFDMRTSDDTVIQREHWWMNTLSSIRSDESGQNGKYAHGYNTWHETEEIEKKLTK